MVYCKHVCDNGAINMLYRSVLLYSFLPMVLYQMNVAICIVLDTFFSQTDKCIQFLDAKNVWQCVANINSCDKWMQLVSLMHCFISTFSVHVLPSFDEIEEKASKTAPLAIFSSFGGWGGSSLPHTLINLSVIGLTTYNQVSYASVERSESISSCD